MPDYVVRTRLSLDSLEVAAPASSSSSNAKGRALVRYVLLATIAVISSLACPRTTLFGEGAHPVRLILTLGIIYGLTIASLVVLQRGDPGFLTTTANPTATNDTTTTEEEGDEEEPRDNDNDQQELVERPLHRKFCESCGIYPPLRSHHCKTCQRCVATFDHHCDFVGTCIGERNHCRFWIFLTLQSIGFLICAHIVSTSRLGLATLMWNEDDSAFSFVAALIKLFIYPLTFASGLMWIVHSIIALCNTTTFEFAKGRHLDYLEGTVPTDCPFSQGCFGNVRIFCQRDSLYEMITGRHAQWNPIQWRISTDPVDRNAEDWWNHPFQNKYWSCW